MVSHLNTAELPNASLARHSASPDHRPWQTVPTCHGHFKFRRVEMTNSPAGDNASNARASMSTDAPKSTCPAARKFAEYLARRMKPMIENARANKQSNGGNATPEQTDWSQATRGRPDAFFAALLSSRRSAHAKETTMRRIVTETCPSNQRSSARRFSYERSVMLGLD
jgi:hypothetical protein